MKIILLHTHVHMHDRTYHFSPIRRSGYYFIRCSFCAATIEGVLQFERSVFFFGNPADIQRQDKVGVNETVTELTTARYCQWYAQLFNPAVSQGNDSYNTNSPSPSTSMVTVVRNYSHMCTCHIY